MRAASIVVLSLLVLGCGRGGTIDAPPVLPLHEVGPWPWASSLIAYDDRLWFVNSDRTRDCSCADLYSLDPATGVLRYERHLFSQSVGRPVVQGGLLYWPYEDPRWSVGSAHVAVTDGEHWRLLTLEDEQPLLHGTAMASGGGTLWLSTANPGLRLFASSDGGRSWTAQGRPRPQEGLRWVLRTVSLDGGLYGVITDAWRSRKRSLARIDAGQPVPMRGLPQGADILQVIVHDGRLVALVELDGTGSLWTSGGGPLDRLGPAPPRGRLRDIATDAAGRLWALSLEARGGLVWRRDDTGEWHLEASIEDGLPQELVLMAGRPYAAGHHRGGTGALWSATGPVETRESGRRAALPAPIQHEGEDWSTLAERARHALAEPGAYQAFAREARANLHALARSSAPPESFERLLDVPFPDAHAPFLENATPVPTHLLGPWLSLWAIAVAGRGHVPVSMLTEPWPAAPLGHKEKHFEPVLAALAAIAWTGQADPATVDALIARLDAPNDPLWLRGDVVGALTSGTGQRYGYDVDAWRRWWREARPSPR